MKKNLMSVLILVLLVVNIVMTSIMMFSVVGMANKTSALVGDIASAIKLETSAGLAEEAAPAVTMADTEPYDIADQLMIELKPDEDGKKHYYRVAVTLAMNKKGDGYSDYGSTMASYESLIKSTISDTIGQYTMAEVQGNVEQIKAEILTKIQEMFDSKFVYQVTFREAIFQ